MLAWLLRDALGGGVETKSSWFSLKIKVGFDCISVTSLSTDENEVTGIRLIFLNRNVMQMGAKIYQLESLSDICQQFLGKWVDAI